MAKSLNTSSFVFWTLMIAEKSPDQKHSLSHANPRKAAAFVRDLFYSQPSSSFLFSSSSLRTFIKKTYCKNPVSRLPSSVIRIVRVHFQSEDSFLILSLSHTNGLRGVRFENSVALKSFNI
ncbi:hypothetical protein CEXT_319341 [Caerostris extrusa]|uniref:Uncharacterized protein n=1 Tax=Caerostris extrusa TaxID=172846 RepID=A0AAV4R5P1_CAEEX|nr:hypothetical protein CEXT_319341 [Caerostris extrusa]